LLELATYGGLAKEPGRSWPAHYTAYAHARASWLETKVRN